MPVNDIADPRSEEPNAALLNDATVQAALAGIWFLRPNSVGRTDARGVVDGTSADEEEDEYEVRDLCMRAQAHFSWAHRVYRIWPRRRCGSGDRTGTLYLIHKQDTAILASPIRRGSLVVDAQDHAGSRRPGENVTAPADEEGEYPKVTIVIAVSREHGVRVEVQRNPRSLPTEDMQHILLSGEHEVIAEIKRLADGARDG